MVQPPGAVEHPAGAAIGDAAARPTRAERERNFMMQM